MDPPSWIAVTKQASPPWPRSIYNYLPIFVFVHTFQTVRLGSLTAEGQSALWQDRWTLRRRVGGAQEQLVSPSSEGGRRSVVAPTQPTLDCPVFLVAYASCVLDAGKYLNLIRLCDRPLPESVLEGPLEYDDRGRFALALQGARAVAGRAAMRLLRGDEGLSKSLDALRRYFLTAQGDLFGHLLDSAGAAEFNRMAAAVPLAQLHSVLSAAVAATSAADDPVAHELRAAFDTRSILNMLVSITQSMAAVSTTGTSASAVASSPSKNLRAVTPGPLPAGEHQTVGRQRSARESFMLCYAVPWPLSIVAPEACMAQYQMVFRHLLELKWVERELNRVWKLYQQTRSLANIQSRLGKTGKASTPRNRWVYILFARWYLYVFIYPSLFLLYCLLYSIH